MKSVKSVVQNNPIEKLRFIFQVYDFNGEIYLLILNMQQFHCVGCASNRRWICFSG